MFPEFKDDFLDVVARAKAAGLTKVVNVGCGRDASARSVEMADGEFLYATVGLHPYDALDVSEDLMREWERIILKDKANFEKMRLRRIVAVGETGLDYFKAKIDHEKQKQSFRMHLELAQSVGLPVIVHNRGADEDCLKLLREFPHVNAVFHCFGSSLDFARVVWDAGYLTSFTGIITYPNAVDLRKVVAEVAMDKFMVETDCPYLAPQAYRGKRNEPAYVEEVVKEIAKVKGCNFQELAKIATSNTEVFFGLSG